MKSSGRSREDDEARRAGQVHLQDLHPQRRAGRVPAAPAHDERASTPALFPATCWAPRSTATSWWRRTRSPSNRQSPPAIVSPPADQQLPGPKNESGGLLDRSTCVATRIVTSRCSGGDCAREREDTDVRGCACRRWSTSDRGNVDPCTSEASAEDQDAERARFERVRLTRLSTSFGMELLAP